MRWGARREQEPVVRRHRAEPLPIVLAMLLLAVPLAACQGLPSTSCPQPPSTWTIGSGQSAVQLNPSDYPVASRSADTSIDIELSQRYMRERIRAQIEGHPAGSPLPDSGVAVGDVRLSERGTDADKINLVSVTIRPWLRGGQNGDQMVDLNRTYSLRLRILPYLVNESTVPDETKRRALLRTTESGAVLRFELFELFSFINNAPVSCTSPNFDPIDSRVLAGVYETLGRQEPLVLPAEALTGMVNTMLGRQAKLVGMNIGSDLELKIGLLLDQGSPGKFDPQASLVRFPTADWGVSLDRTFVTAAITRKANEETAATDPAAGVNSVSVDYRSSGLDVTVQGVLRKCGDISWTSFVHVTPLVRKPVDARSVVFAPSTQRQENDANILQGACIVFDQVLSSIANPLGKATAVISSGVCTAPMWTPAEFNVGSDDAFYATAVDTDDIFYIAGRSTFIDNLVAARPPIPDCP